MARWTILTPELPPVCGGVGDYTTQVAAALAATGDEVAVACPSVSYPPDIPRGVERLELGDAFGTASRELLDRWLAGQPSILLVQYVPTAFGMGGANLPFCRWLLKRSRRHGNDVRVMFHEPYFEFAWTPVHQSPLSLAQRVMAGILLRTGERTYLSTDAWQRYLAPYAPGGDGSRFLTLPIPSAIPRCQGPIAAREWRTRLTGTAGLLVGHFGTYGTHIAPMLEAALIPLLQQQPHVHAVCVGASGHEFLRALLAKHPALAGRLQATGRLSPADAAAAVSACDLLLQPYPDGVTTRRTSVMAGLINAKPVLTTTGHLTEPVWLQTGGVAATPAGDGGAFVDAARRLLADRPGREALAARGEATYSSLFSLHRTIAALRGHSLQPVAAW